MLQYQSYGRSVWSDKRRNTRAVVCLLALAQAIARDSHKIIGEPLQRFQDYSRYEKLPLRETVSHEISEAFAAEAFKRMPLHGILVAVPIDSDPLAHEINKT